jgi:putative toxin-antitoxin system antitoxin component (TIGR02293 family)
MSNVAGQIPAEPAEFERVTSLLGGSRILRRPVRNRLEAHEMLLRGLPGEALQHLLDGLRVLPRTASLEGAVGMSLRTYQRRKGAPARLLNPEQSGRAWKFAEILAKATEVFGSQEEAEEWLQCPAIGLEQRTPLELLATPAGVEIVETFLKRLEYGVYT